MKKYLFILVAVVSVFFTSCEYETLPTYSGTDQIYFSYADNTQAVYIIDSIIINFGYDLQIKQDSTISIGVTVQGKVVDYDRPVKFILVDTSSTAKLGQDIVLLPELSFVPAGERTGKILIKLNNTKNLNDTVFVAALRLVENEYFAANYYLTANKYLNTDILDGKSTINSTEYRIRFNNGNEKPNWWANATYGVRFDMIFGAYSKEKFKLMCEILPGCSREYFTYQDNTTAAELSSLWNTYFPMGLLAGWAMGLNTYLNNYKEKNGEPLRDENGNEIKSGTMYM